jgi:hypothetical protein
MPLLPGKRGIDGLAEDWLKQQPLGAGLSKQWAKMVYKAQIQALTHKFSKAYVGPTVSIGSEENVIL